MDAQVFWDPSGANSCWHGVTTVVMGNCGFTLAPVRGDARALVVRNLERAEDIDPAALAEGIDWSWRRSRSTSTRSTGCPRHQLRGQRRPLRAAHVGDGRARLRGRVPTTTTSRHDAHSWRTRSAPAPSGSRRRAANTTRRPTTGRSRRGSRRGTRCAAGRRDGRSSARGSSKAATAACWRPSPRRRERALARMRDLAADDRCPITFGLHRDPRRRDARLHRRGRSGRWSHDRAIALPRHQCAAVVRDPAALRPAARVAESRALPDADRS